MRRQVETWRAQQLTNATAKLIIYRAFIEDELDAPKHLARRVHELYFAPEHEDFQPRTMWSLSNAFTSAFKELDPIPQFKATAKLGPYLERVPGPDRSARHTGLAAPAGLLNKKPQAVFNLLGNARWIALVGRICQSFHGVATSRQLEFLNATPSGGIYPAVPGKYQQRASRGA